jgi:hypothetical protein
MIGYIRSRGILAAVMAIGLFAQQVVPERDTVISRPITLVEAQQANGAALVTIPWAVYIAALTVDAALINTLVNLFIESSNAQEDKRPLGAM